MLGLLRLSFLFLLFFSDVEEMRSLVQQEARRRVYRGCEKAQENDHDVED